MPAPPHRRRTAPRFACVVLLLAFAAACCVARAQSDDAQRKAQQTKAQQKLDTVRAQIAQITAKQRATATQRDSIDAALTQQATLLDQASRALADSDAALAAKQQALQQLQTQRAAIEARLSTQRAALAELLRAAYALGRGSDLSLLLGDEDVGRIARTLAYSRYFQRGRVQRIRALLDDAAQLDRLQASIAAEQAALQKQRDERAQQEQVLQQARDAQQHLLAAADAQLAKQGAQLAALQQQAQALDQLLQKLKDVFADIPKQLGGQRPFVQLRGALPWPAPGRARAGTGLLAHGLLIAAPAGTAVRAVAYGRVAFADFLRGYGMLVIVDHGDGYMSLYGNNEAALVGAGDWVGPGQTIATVGRGQDQAGAYFEIRKDGKTVDPRPWLSARR